VDYEYDVFDRSITKTVDSDGEGAAKAETERFVYDGEHIALVFDGKGQQTDRYLYGPQIDQILADEVSTGVVHWALTDYQGSVRDIVNNQGQLLNHIRYDSFGNITSQSNANLDFRFSYTGREFDEEIGLYYYRARYYDSSTGRFISEDPMGFGAGDSNLYRYVGNSPTNFTDPSGNFAIGWHIGLAASVIVPMTIAGALFPNPAQTPTETCDMDPTDNEGARMAIEIVTSLGMGIGTTLARRAVNSLLDDLVRASKTPQPFSIDPDLANTNLLGYTKPDGSIFLRPGLSEVDQLETLRHESVHAFFSPRGNSKLAVFRQNIGQLAYNNSQLVRYTEEAIAETYGTGSLIQGLKHPLEGYDITIGGLATESVFVGGTFVGAGYFSFQFANNKE
jgi:RHS repeat-associated protein